MCKIWKYIGHQHANTRQDILLVGPNLMHRVFQFTFHSIAQFQPGLLFLQSSSLSGKVAKDGLCVGAPVTQRKLQIPALAWSWLLGGVNQCQEVSPFASLYVPPSSLSLRFKESSSSKDNLKDLCSRKSVFVASLSLIRSFVCGFLIMPWPL